MNPTNPPGPGKVFGHFNENMIVFNGIVLINCTIIHFCKRYTTESLKLRPTDVLIKLMNFDEYLENEAVVEQRNRCINFFIFVSLKHSYYFEFHFKL